MDDGTKYTDGLRQLADIIDAAANAEPSIRCPWGAAISVDAPPDRVARAARALSGTKPWEAMEHSPGFKMHVGPHNLHLFIRDTPTPDPLADPNFVSPVRALIRPPKGVA